MNSIRLLFTFLIFIAAVDKLPGQNNLQLHYGYRGGVSAAKFLPSTLNLGDNRFMIGFNYKVWVANRSLSYKTIRDIESKQKISADDIGSFIDELDRENIIGVGQDIMLMGVATSAKIRQRKINIGFSISDRMSASFRYPRELLELAWRGNGQFEGQTIDLSSISLDARYFREYALLASMEVLRTQKVRLRTGVSAKYLAGLAAIYMPENALFFTTGTNGDYLELEYGYEVMMAGLEDFSFFEKKGHGFATNLGVTLSYKKRYHIDLALSDIGSIGFYSDTKVFNDNNTIHYSGLTREDLEDVTNYADSLANIFDNKTIEGKHFSMPLGARLMIQFSYQFINDKVEKNPGNLFLTYVQGFSELPGVTRKPRVSVGYNHRVFRRIFLGASSSWGGFTNLALGGLIGVRFGRTRIGFHCDDFTGLILPKYGTGAGLGFILQSSF